MEGEDEAGARPDAGPGGDRSSSSSSFEDLASAEVDEARRAVDSAPPEPEWQDVLGSGDLLKKELVRGEEGEEEVRPQRGDVCRVSYEVRLREGGALVEARDEVDVHLGDNEVLQGLDLALSLMCKGQRCALRIAPRFGYGAQGLAPGEPLGAVWDMEGRRYAGPRVRPDAWLDADVTLQGWSEEPEHEGLTFAQRMDMGRRRRVRGNWWYGRGDATLATQLYRRALDALDESAGGISEPTVAGPPAPTSDELQALLEERVRVHNNMAAAQLRAGAYDAALQAVSRVLSCEPNNAKALYRKARTLSAMGRTDEALAAARAAEAAAPEDASARREVARCEARATRDRSAERRLARRMLGARGAGVAGAAGPAADPKKSSRVKMLMWGSLLLSLVVGVASALVYRYKTQSQ